MVRGMIHLPRDNKNIHDLAQAVVNSPALVEIAKIHARAIGVPPGQQFAELRVALALAYAHGYVRGRSGQSAEPAMPVRPDPLGPNG